MGKSLKNVFPSMLLILGVLSGSAGLALTSPLSAHAADPKPKVIMPVKECDAYLLTLPAWFNGLAGKNGGECTVVSPQALGSDEGALGRFIWIIGLNVLQILLQIVAYLSVGFIIYGGFVYLTSAGRSDKITRGREMIQNAVIGLVISLLAVALVAFVGGQIKIG